MQRSKRWFSRRATAVMLTAGVLVLSGAFQAFAHHQACTDEPPGNHENSAHASLQDSWVWVQPNSSTGYAIGNDANNLAILSNGGNDRVCAATPQGGGDYIITNTDSNPSLGTTFSTSGTGALTPAGIGRTGAEVGTPASVIGVVPTCLQGTTVWVNGGPTGPSNVGVCP